MDQVTFGCEINPNMRQTRMLLTSTAEALNLAACQSRTSSLPKPLGYTASLNTFDE